MLEGRITLIEQQGRADARDLPKSTSGVDLSEWASRILDKFGDFDEKRKKKIKETVDEGLEGWQKAIAAARRFNEPAVMDAEVAALAFHDGGEVPAMLTPGEHVVGAPIANRLGAGLLNAINAIAVPRGVLAGMMQPPMPVSRFADGGQVLAGGGGFREGGKNPRGAFAPTVNLNVSVADLYSRDNVTRFLLPVLRDIDNRSR